MDSQELDRVFGALSDPIRRGILVCLSEGERNVSQLTEAFYVSQHAISRHLRLLLDAGLIKKEKRGREHFIRAEAEQAKRAAAWITHYSAFWRAHFDEVQDILDSKREHQS